ncbi:MAG: hypothetical protein A2268_00755 [Candidatus Raymondbacteria bacterium RifOxyA12_full_50_37]|uniref:Outer membrane protein beta-barrel domain-containing protein n=1 Tax=Candidatus Raymondbacteria bacterium RIFOXYD12_FULL_49_13 TaxID=1817890 RepID=A0A1F7F1Q4_UNCRA|nr:MAG: hypothetical protein A2268_00755 [Candidatus Raymondbacteria bacterium RifOxyA12_full_50_37]OGJ90059.1 MAG: hypothetical protein A2248_19085 [Candidatus Raymondbacteria bacterium RIFOXYA2_FULL_49_16]OGJ92876.1 MAG: hypothetical protein A2487_09650 [Candidatus Raymondbacteria bacterium RifOxyC12_full_50_8]OGJ96700.1 MAG: hypothetical protein A2350_01940 [Candidatus Raymondbacteria bacterium RifOxyB12_full_50_8]OGJ96743.1 MAG: hypothetical protein A2453_06210 [Candidatus Raymondbacteria b
MKSVLLPSLLCVISCAGAFSLYSIDKNPYSLGSGEYMQQCGARQCGMGGAGLALSDSVNYNSANPATFGGIDFTTVSVTYRPEMTFLKDAHSGFKDFSNDFPFAELTISLGPYGTIFGGYRREQLLDYSVRYTDAQGYLIDRTGFGGTYGTFGGYALELQKRFAMGLSFEALYGRTSTSTAIVERPSEEFYLQPSLLQKTRFKAYQFTLGGMARLGKWSVAASGTAPLPLTGSTIDREHQIIQNYSGSDSVVIKQIDFFDETFVPLRGSMGCAYTPFKRLHCALDLNTVFWHMEGRGSEYRVGVGAEYFFADKRSPHYFLNIPLRAGYYFHDLGYNQAVVEQAGTFGFTLPTRNNYGSITVGLEAGRRYGDAYPEYVESFARISIQMTHKGRWGRLRRLKDFTLEPQ